MAKLLTMPRLGETMEQGTVRSWLVKAGVPYKRGDVIAEVETDKTVVELPALEDGVVERFLAGDGDVVSVGAPLAELRGQALSDPSSGASRHLLPQGGKERAAAATASRVEPPRGDSPSPPAGEGARRADEGSGNRRPLASPAARKLAKKHGIDLAAIPATGRQGRVQGWDIRAALASFPGEAKRRPGNVMGAHANEVPGSAARPGNDGVLHFSLRGEGDKTPVVLLHGFAGDKDGWLNLAVPLSQHRKVIALDLPGHGGSKAHPARNGKTMAETVLATLQGIGVSRAHLIGHSMGGAVALAAALHKPELAASLTLFAPGGVGPGINARLLARFAAAKSEAEIAIVLDQFFGPGSAIPRGLAAAIAATRSDEAVAALVEIAASMQQGTEQRAIPTERLAAIEAPIRVIWGEDDHVLPFTNARFLPGIAALHRYPGVGHMPQIEIGRDAVRLAQLTISAE